VGRTSGHMSLKDPRCEVLVRPVSSRMHEARLRLRGPPYVKSGLQHRHDEVQCVETNGEQGSSGQSHLRTEDLGSIGYGTDAQLSAGLMMRRNHESMAFKTFALYTA